MRLKVEALLTGDYPSMSLLELQRIGARQAERRRFDDMMAGFDPEPPEWGIETWFGDDLQDDQEAQGEA